MSHSRDYQLAWRDYEDRVLGLFNSSAGKKDLSILELGGGRSPTFSKVELADRVLSYTVNDISSEELDLLPVGYDRACFDVCGDVSAQAGKYDVIFSKMLAEHVQDGAQMHANVLQMLKPGGVAFHFMPVLYTSPFVVNVLLPERLSRKIVWTLFPHRRSEEPKFPAYYSMCRGGSERQHARLRSIGYADVEITTFYGHSYYDKVPGLSHIEAALSGLAARRNWHFYGSFAYYELRKGV